MPLADSYVGQRAGFGANRFGQQSATFGLSTRMAVGHAELEAAWLGWVGVHRCSLTTAAARQAARNPLAFGNAGDRRGFGSITVSENASRTELVCQSAAHRCVPGSFAGSDKSKELGFRADRCDATGHCRIAKKAADGGRQAVTHKERLATCAIR